jgi:hypothetical protein
MSAVRVFTTEVITRIREMKAAGAKPAVIAKEIGTTPGSLRARFCQLGLTKKRAKRAVRDHHDQVAA